MAKIFRKEFNLEYFSVEQLLKFIEKTKTGLEGWEISDKIAIELSFNPIEAKEKTLIVIDFENHFRNEIYKNHVKNYIENSLNIIKKFIENNYKIIVVEYKENDIKNDILDLYSEAKELLVNYSKVSFIKKNKQNGSDEIIKELRRLNIKLNKENIFIIGSLGDFCVYETIAGFGEATGLLQKGVKNITVIDKGIYFNGYENEVELSGEDFEKFKKNVYNSYGNVKIYQGKIEDLKI